MFSYFILKSIRCFFLIVISEDTLLFNTRESNNPFPETIEKL